MMGRMGDRLKRERALQGEWASVAGALAVGLALRLWFVWRQPYVVGDTLVYGDLARNLLLHHAYGFSQAVNGVAVAPRPTLIRLPGYPLFLAACFWAFGVGRYTAVMLVQAGVDLGSCLLAGGVAGRVFGRRARVAAVWLAAVCPFTANYVAAPLTETLTIFCMAMAFYGLARWQARVTDEECRGVNRWLFVIAAALGYAILLRPEQGLLAAAVVPALGWVLLRRGGVREVVGPVLLVSGLTLVLLVPWAMRNWWTFHVVGAAGPAVGDGCGGVRSGGVQPMVPGRGRLSTRRPRRCTGSTTGTRLSQRCCRRGAFNSAAQYAETAAVLEDYNQTTTATPALDARFEAIARARIRAQP